MSRVCVEAGGGWLPPNGSGRGQRVTIQSYSDSVAWEGTTSWTFFVALREGDTHDSRDTTIADILESLLSLSLIVGQDKLNCIDLTSHFSFFLYLTLW